MVFIYIEIISNFFYNMLDFVSIWDLLQYIEILIFKTDTWPWELLTDTTFTVFVMHDDRSSTPLFSQHSTLPWNALSNEHI